MTTPTLPVAPLTALEAVNLMLASIGQGAVNSLTASASVDAESAKNALMATTREVQSRGWWFNREYCYPLQADSTGAILLPEGVLKFQVDPRYGNLVQRGGRLYDADKHTSTFDPGFQVTGEIVWLFPFDDLPHTARQYIGRRAGREFQIGAIGSDLLYKFTREMEDEAQTELMREHLRSVKSNVVSDNALVSWTASGTLRYRR